MPTFSPFVISLYVLMVLTVFVMIWANLQYRTKGVLWGRPLAGVCGVIATVLAILAIIMTTTNWGTMGSNSKAREKEERYQYVAYKRLGSEIAKRHAGAKILLIRYPTGTGETVVSMNKAIMDGLKEGLAGKANIEREHELRFATSVSRGDGAPGMGPMPEGPILTAAKFDEIVDTFPECTVVLSLVDLPSDVSAMKLWKKAEEGKAPALALVIPRDVGMLREAIEQKYVTVVLNLKPGAYDWKAPVPEDEGEAFNRRFLIITPDNVAEMAAKYPLIFPKYEKPAETEKEGEGEGAN